MIATNKLQKASYYARKQVLHCSPYVWAGQGQKLRKLTVLALAKMENSAANVARVMKFIYEHLKLFDKHTKVFDCSGLICCILIYAGVFKAGTDMTAQGLYNTFKKIAPGNAREGDLMFKESNGSITHVGYVIEPGKIIEAKGRDYGVVESTIDSTWTKAARPDYI